MRPRLLPALLLACFALAFAGRAGAQPLLYHGTLSVRTAKGGIDKSAGIASLRVNGWNLGLTKDSNGIAPDKEPVIIAIGETERLVIPAGEVHVSPNGKRFTFRNPKIDRGIRSLVIRRLKDDGDGTARYRVSFSLVGIDLSALVIEYPLCRPMAVIVGDDDGFSGIELDRPGGFVGSRVKVLGACNPEGDWPWV